MCGRVALAVLVCVAPLACLGCGAQNIGRYNEMAFGDTKRVRDRILTACDTADGDRDALLHYWLGAAPVDAGARVLPAAAKAAPGKSSSVATAGELLMGIRAAEPDALGDQQAMTALPIGDERGARVQARKLIRDAALVLGVGNREESARRAQALAVRLGGYVQESTTEAVVLRVPSDRFDTALEDLAAMGLLVDRKVQARDVTEDYADLELRLRAKRSMLARLQELVKKAEKVEDLLKIEQEISRLVTEIEQLEGKLRLMNNQVAFSKIAVAFQLSTRTAAVQFTARLPFYWLRTLGLRFLVD